MPVPLARLSSRLAHKLAGKRHGTVPRAVGRIIQRNLAPPKVSCDARHLSILRSMNNETGKVFEADSCKLYEIRRPKGLLAQEPVRRFLKGKPRYRHFRGVLVMVRKRSRPPPSTTVCRTSATEPITNCGSIRECGMWQRRLNS